MRVSESRDRQLFLRDPVMVDGSSGLSLCLQSYSIAGGDSNNTDSRFIVKEVVI